MKICAKLASGIGKGSKEANKWQGLLSFA
jgi:hypothetical protein